MPSHPRIHIRTKNCRGEWAPLGNLHGTKHHHLNVTTAAPKGHPDRALSPMTPVAGGYKGVACFENFWQGGKFFEGVSAIRVQTWYSKQVVGKRRYPGSKGRQCIGAYYPDVCNTVLDYIASRKKVYAPLYADWVKTTPRFQHWQKVAENTDIPIVVSDFDGPRAADKTPLMEEISVNLLREKINDPSSPFGHGYVVAGLLAGIEPSEYCE